MEDTLALGMIETKGLIGLIEASDAAVKAARIELVDYEKSGGGLTIIKFRGTVGAVKAAVEAGALAAQKVGELVSTHIIPNPDRGVEPMIVPSEPPNTNEPAKEFHKWGKYSSSQNMRLVLNPDDKRLAEIIEKYKNEGVDSLDYNEIRYLARRIENFPLPKSRIRNAGRGQLAKIISAGKLEIVEK